MTASSNYFDANQDYRRGLIRNRVFMGGKILFNNGASVVDCLVRNRSDAGALLTMGDTVGLPQHFTLVIGDEPPRKATTRWRRPTSAGVSFD